MVRRQPAHKMSENDAFEADHRSTNGGTPGASSLAAVNEQLDRLTASDAFRNSDRLVHLLRFLVDKTLLDQRQHLKEYVLGTEVFGRPSSFDPRTDSIVRVEASRLRSKLRLYYAVEGCDDPVLIELPKGTYVPAVTVRRPAPHPAQAAPRTAVAPPVVPRRRWPRLSPAMTWVLSAALLVALGIGAVVGLRGRSGPDAPREALAVLPFLTASANLDDERLTEGFVDELTTAFARVPGLRVPARSSAFRFAGSGHDLAAVGRALGVGSVVEGSIRRVGTRLRISVQLVRAGDATHLWAETFEREGAELYAVQAEIVRGVTAALRTEAARAGPQPASPRAPDPAAYDLYLKGRAFRSEGTVEGLAKGVALFEAAIAADPTLAIAYAALADAQVTIAFHGLRQSNDAIDRARQAVEKALSLDDSIAEAHLALACIRLTHDWDWTSAEPAFRRALELNPNDARAHEWYAIGLATRSRFDQATTESRKALELDPLSTVAAGDLATILFFAGRVDEAITQAKRALAADPSVTVLHVIVGQCLMKKRRVPEAIAEFRKALDQSHQFSLVVGRLGNAYAVAGQRNEALAMLRQIETTQLRSGTPNVEMAYIHAGLGDKEKAFACLERALAEREGELLFLNVTPTFDGLKSDPRFGALAKRVGLP